MSQVKSVIKKFNVVKMRISDKVKLEIKIGIPLVGKDRLMFKNTGTVKVKFKDLTEFEKQKYYRKK